MRFVKRDVSLEAFYTKPHVVQECLKHINVFRYDFVMDPCAGDGAFSRCIKGCFAIDIDPAHHSVLKYDFFDYEIPCKDTLVIGNPPFGISCELSNKFLLKCFRSQNVKTIAFILNETYKKHTKQRIIPKGWCINKIVDIGSDAFTLNGESKHVPSSFFIFERGGKDLRAKMIDSTPDFSFGTPEDFDFFLFGASYNSKPLRISTLPQPNNRGHYLKSNIGVNKLKERLEKLNIRGFSGCNGGLYYVTKKELTTAYVRRYC